MDTHRLAQLLFPGVTRTPAQVEALYPPRPLPQGAKVTRMAPSPTGFMHLGNLYGALVDERLAHQSGGVFYLRIEDTDKKREVPGGVATILQAFADFHLPFDEGVTKDGETGAYGPYYQSRRAEIYHVFVKWLVEQGMAYPCFCTEEELAAIRAQQEERQDNFGYYGQYAKWRDRPLEEIEERLQRGESYVVRFRSTGSIENKIRHTDLVKGEMELTENDQDVVLLKSDGIPTYHFAHVVDDHLMGTTHVVRGEEWLATLPIHLQLFAALGWKRPKYVHTAQLMKLDAGKKRKLSKRKDPELALDFYYRQGYPAEAVLEYLMTLLNSNFEEWRRANPEASRDEFAFSTKKMSSSGALFDLDKLIDVSKNWIARQSAEEVYRQVSAWAAGCDEQLCSLLQRDPGYATRIFAIGRGGKKPRKDIARWGEVRAYLDFFFDELFQPDYTAMPAAVSRGDAAAILREWAALPEREGDEEWFDTVKALAARHGYAPETKLYKQNPAGYKGHVGDVSMVLRVAVCGRASAPDLQASMAIIGKERVADRLERAAAAMEE